MSVILGVGHFEFSCKMLYFMNILVFRYESRYVSSALCPEGFRTVWCMMKKYDEIFLNANSFWLLLPINMKWVLIDSLGHAENNYTNYAMVGWIVYELLLDCLSNFQEIFRPCWQKVIELVKPFSNNTWRNSMMSMPKWIWGYISVML